MLDVYGDTRLFLFSPPSNRPESAESTDLTEGASIQVSSPDSLDFSWSSGWRWGSRSDGEGWKREFAAEGDDDAAGDETVRNQPMLDPGLLWCG